MARADPYKKIRVTRIRKKRDRGRFIAWVGHRSVIGTYATAEEAQIAARVVVDTQDVPRVCTLRDIDVARREMGKVVA